MVTLQSKFTAGIIGSALGDGIGELAFRHSRNRSPETFTRAITEWPKYEYTDDTAMAIGIMESLIAKSGILVQEHLGDTFAKNFYQEPYRGYASGPPTIFETVKRLQMPYVEVAKKLFDGKGSFGNGAAMRIAPIGVFFYNDPHLREQVILSSTVTHSHELAIDGADILAYAIAKAMHIDPQQEFSTLAFADDLIAYARTDIFRTKMTLVKELLASPDTPLEAAHRLVLSVATDESVPFAIYSFLKYPHSYHDCLYCAILNGGDRDTMGAMAGGLSGAYLGMEAIPKEWIEKLENLPKFLDLIQKLWQIKK